MNSDMMDVPVDQQQQQHQNDEHATTAAIMIHDGGDGDDGMMESRRPKRRGDHDDDDDEDDDLDRFMMSQSSSSSPNRKNSSNNTNNNMSTAHDHQQHQQQQQEGDGEISPNNRQKYDLKFRCPSIDMLTIVAARAPTSKAPCTQFKIKTQFANVYNVDRGLKHFEWLYIMVSDEYPGCLLPPRSLIQARPPVSSLSNSNSNSGEDGGDDQSSGGNTVIHHRNIFLEKFIQRIVVHDKLRNSKRLYEFLTLDTTTNMEQVDLSAAQLFGLGDSGLSTVASPAPSASSSSSSVDDSSSGGASSIAIASTSSSSGSSGSTVTTSGLFYSFRKWKLSSSTRTAVNEQALDHYKKMRQALDVALQSCRKTVLKQQELLSAMDGVGRDLKVLANVDQLTVYNEMHELGDTLMNLNRKTIKYPNVTQLERNIEWYRAFFLPGLIAYLELPQGRQAELQLAQNTLADLEKKFDVLEKKNLDAVMANNPKHEKQYMEMKQKLHDHKEFVDRMSTVVKELEQEQPIELKQFHKTMALELGEGMMNFINSRMESEAEYKEAFQYIKKETKAK